MTKLPLVPALPAAACGAFLLSTAAACGGSTSGQTAPEASAEAPGAAAAPELVSDFSPAPYAAFPEDTEGVLRVSFDALRKSGLWDVYRQLVFGESDAEHPLVAIQRTCDPDPVTELEELWLGGPSSDLERSVVVVKGPTREAVERCGNDLAEAENLEFSAAREGALSHYTLGENELWVGWLNDRTFATGLRAQRDREWLERRIRGREGLRPEAPLPRLLDEQIDLDAGLWLGMLPSEGTRLARGFARGGDLAPDALYASLGARERLALDVGLRFASEAEATDLLQQARQFRSMLAMQEGALGAVAETAELEREGAHFELRAEATAADFAELARSIGPISLPTPAPEQRAQSTANAPSEPAAKTPSEPAAKTPSEPAPKREADDPEEIEERGVRFLEEVAETGVRHKANCDRVAAEWRALIDENEALLEDMRTHSRNQTPEEKSAFEERYSDRLDAFMADMTETMQACEGNEKIFSLVEELSAR